MKTPIEQCPLDNLVCETQTLNANIKVLKKSMLKN